MDAEHKEFNKLTHVSPVISTSVPTVLTKVNNNKVLEATSATTSTISPTTYSEVIPASSNNSLPATQSKTNKN